MATQQQKEIAVDVITSAVESGIQGIGGWARVKSYRWQDPAIDPAHKKLFAEAQIIEVGDGDEANEFTVNAETIVKAIQTLRAGWVENLAESYRAKLIGQTYLARADCDLDANDADILVQIGLFGKVVYG